MNEEIALKKAIDDIEAINERGSELKPQTIRNIQNKYLLLGDDIHKALMEFAYMLQNTEKVFVYISHKLPNNEPHNK